MIQIEEELFAKLEATLAEAQRQQDVTYKSLLTANLAMNNASEAIKFLQEQLREANARIYMFEAMNKAKSWIKYLC